MNAMCLVNTQTTAVNGCQGVLTSIIIWCKLSKPPVQRSHSAPSAASLWAAASAQRRTAADHACAGVFMASSCMIWLLLPVLLAPKKSSRGVGRSSDTCWLVAKTSKGCVAGTCGWHRHGQVRVTGEGNTRRLTITGSPLSVSSMTSGRCMGTGTQSQH
jgi:hypothetical protein